MAKTHKHKTIAPLALGPAIALAVATTPKTRQAQIDNLTPAQAGDSVLFSDDAGFYIRVTTADEQAESQSNMDYAQKYAPAWTLEEASRWDSTVIQDVLTAVQTDMAAEGVTGDQQPQLRAMTYADALVQERDNLNGDGDDDAFGGADPAGQGEMDPKTQDLLDSLFGDF